jgi:hypothetical protein
MILAWSTTNTHLYNTKDDKILGTIKKIRMPTWNKKMTTNNSKGFEKEPQNTMGTRLDMKISFSSNKEAPKCSGLKALDRMSNT